MRHRARRGARLSDATRRRCTAAAAVAAIAAAATAAAHLASFLGAPVLALLIGAVIAAATRAPGAVAPELSRIGRWGLQAGIVLFGVTISLRRVAVVGRDTIPVLAVTLATALVVAVACGRALGVGRRLQALVGVGTAICGASAIAAVASVITVTEAELAYALSTVFAFNVVAVVSFPAIGHALGLSAVAYGVWAGTAVNDTSSVVAAAYAYGGGAAVTAIVVKLARTTMLLPIVAGLAFGQGRNGRESERRSWTRALPRFLIWFVLAAAIATAGVVPRAVESSARSGAVLLLTVALAGVGLTTRFGELRRAGARPLLLGALVWFAVAASSLAVQRATGAW